MVENANDVCFYEMFVQSFGSVSLFLPSEARGPAAGEAGGNVRASRTRRTSSSSSDAAVYRIVKQSVRWIRESKTIRQIKMRKGSNSVASIIMKPKCDDKARPYFRGTRCRAAPPSRCPLPGAAPGSLPSPTHSLAALEVAAVMQRPWRPNRRA